MGIYLFQTGSDFFFFFVGSRRDKSYKPISFVNESSHFSSYFGRFLVGSRKELRPKEEKWRTYEEVINNCQK